VTLLELEIVWKLFAWGVVFDVAFTDDFVAFVAVDV
jgi:hypothetical protein